VIAAVWMLDAISTMRISYCQNIKRSAQAVLKVQCLFHRCFRLVSWLLCWFHLRGASFLAAAQMCFLWAKAEVATETRQVFRPVEICCSGWLLRWGSVQASETCRTKL
jgi:hypothetical protein